jgi:hypothetical protein
VLDISIIGEELDQFELPVESSKVREFARALFDDAPAYEDEPAARAAGYDGIPVLTLRGAVSATNDIAGEQLADLELTGARQTGDVVVKGRATVRVRDRVEV